MDILQQTPLRGYFAIDGVASATSIFPSATGTRWNMLAFAISWQNMTNSSTIAMWETATGTNSVNFFSMMVSATHGFRTCYLGGVGFQSSDTMSALKVTNGTAGTVTGMFVGYRTGAATS